MKILLHICCAVCASSCVERLKEEGHEIIGYFYNPNIHPEEEYRLRLEEVKRIAQEKDFPLIVADYGTESWFDQVKGLEEEPEGGKRCSVCFMQRLTKAALKSKEKECAGFTTTLTVSPHKDAAVINAIGKDVGGGQFLVYDFKKREGFRRAQALAKEHNLYHQHYCGCIYSLNERLKKAGA